MDANSNLTAVWCTACGHEIRETDDAVWRGASGPQHDICPEYIGGERWVTYTRNEDGQTFTATYHDIRPLGPVAVIEDGFREG